MAATCTARAATSNAAGVAADVVWLKRHALAELAALIQSLGVSLEQAALRGHDTESEVHARQLRAVLLEIIDLVKELKGRSE